MDDFWSVLLQNILQAFLPVVAAAAVGYLAQVVNRIYSDFRDRQPDKAWLLSRAVGMAVQAAEQAGAASYFDTKKDYALSIAENFLRSNGVKLDLELIDAAVEAAVWEQFNKDRPATSTNSVTTVEVE